MEMVNNKMKVALIPNDFSMDLEKVFQLCNQHSVQYVELAYMWGKSILDLNEEELKKVESLLNKYDLKTASIQTQIMKVFPPDAKLHKEGKETMHRDFAYNKNRIDRAIILAKRFQAKYIIGYSFFTYLEKVTKKNWNLLLETYAEFLPKLREAGVIMAIECEGDTYIQDIDSYLRLFHHFDDDPHLQANLDLSNLYSKQNIFDKGEFNRIRPYLSYLHVKDRKWRKILWNKSAVFGEGSVRWEKVLKWLKESKYTGFLSIEPHVHGKNKFEKGRQCVLNLQNLLKKLSISYE